MENKSKLNDRQLLAACHVTGPMLVVAGPGSGKTFLLVERIIKLIENGIDQKNILVITFSKKAAVEMRNRFLKRCDSNFKEVTFGTFHAISFGILKEQGIYDADSVMNLETKRRIILRTGNKLGIVNASDRLWQNSMLELISCYKNIGDKIYEKDKLSFDDDERAEFRIVFKIYTELCKKEKLLDFDDMIYEFRRILLSDDKVLKKWQNRFKYILVDEFQDLNEIQYEVLKLIAGKEENIFAVGDDDQSIYGFRGATPGILKTFLSDFTKCRMVQLELNYRSCYQVVAAADKCIRHNSQRIERECQKTLKHRKPGIVSVHCFKTMEEEGEFIAREIGKYNAEDVAVIYRSDHSVMAAENAIRNGGIIYNKRQRQKSFFEINVIAIIVSYLKIAINEGTKEDYLRVINHPKRFISREALNRCDDYMNSIMEYYREEEPDEDIVKLVREWKRINDYIKCFPPYAASIYLIKKLALEKDFDALFKSGIDYSGDLSRLMSEFRQKALKYKSLEAFIGSVERDITESGTIEAVQQKSAVTFITAHASKGLEYPVVFVAGLQEGLFPHHKNLNGTLVEEERRLFYVAMTRAKERLYLCGSGSEHGKRLSRFLNEVGIKPDE